MTNDALPFIDAEIRHVGVSALRLSSEDLAALSQAIVIHDWKDDGKPLAVLLPYEQFLKIQAKILEVP